VFTGAWGSPVSVGGEWNFTSHDAVHPVALDLTLSSRLEPELDEELDRGREVVDRDADVRAPDALSAVTTVGGRATSSAAVDSLPARRLDSDTLSVLTKENVGQTATGTASRNVDGQAIAITVFSPVKWWGRIWLRLVFLYARLVPSSGGDLVRLSFIHFARWSFVRRLPPNRSGQKLRYAHLFFESNFNGGWEEYIDAFSHVLTSGMKAFWGSSYGFPQPLPTAPFKRYIRRNEIEASHFYSAYPKATVTMVRSALDLEGQLEKLRRETEGVDPEAFANAWRDFLTEAQANL
jgi:hypothetical protein